MDNPGQEQSGPLLEWTRPLSAKEREVDIGWMVAEQDEGAWLQDLINGSRGGAPDLSVRENRLPSSWFPPLPSTVPQCRVCPLPQANGICQGCRRLIETLGKPLGSLDFLTLSEKQDQPESTIWAWKTYAHDGSDTAPSDDWLTNMSAALSAYLDAKSYRLLRDDPLVLAIPSRMPLIASVIDQARDRGWFAPELGRSGSKRGGWSQQASSSQVERLGRRSSSWVPSPDVAKGRAVVLIDDVFVTGASMWSYANALKEAGASDVRGVALVRHLHRSTQWNYYDALRISRRRAKLKWSHGNGAVRFF